MSKTGFQNLPKNQSLNKQSKEFAEIKADSDSSQNQSFFSELTNHLCSDACPSEYINRRLTTGEFDAYPFSILKKLVDTPQSPVHHPEGCVWNHVLLVVDQAAQVRHLSHNPLVFMWAALLHDIGKSETTRTRKGRIVSYDHDTVGMDLSVKFLLELTDNHEFIEQVSKLVKYHMHPLYVNKGLPFGDVKGMKAETDMHEMALLGYCDRMGRIGSKAEEEKANIEEFIQKCGVKDVTLSI